MVVLGYFLVVFGPFWPFFWPFFGEDARTLFGWFWGVFGLLGAVLARFRVFLAHFGLLDPVGPVRP